ncbi:hypothetical protein MMC11_005867 [Xylographa trunciseda]|nr:hypothetical protein [Xylographa trunciseda]
MAPSAACPIPHARRRRSAGPICADLHISSNRHSQPTPRNGTEATSRVFPEPPLHAVSWDQCHQLSRKRRTSDSQTEIIPRPKAPPPAPKKADYANFSAADMRYCSIPYSQDSKVPDPLFPIRHRMKALSSAQPLSWHEWVNELPLPHIFRRELGRIEWPDIDVARKGTSKEAQECLITVTIIVEELSAKGRGVVDVLAGVLCAQGYDDVRVELAVYWCSVVDTFPDEYMRGLEQVLAGGLTAFLGH